MAATLFGDIIEPSVFLPYMREEIVRNNNLIRSGIVVPDTELDTLAKTGGTILSLPFWKDLTGDAEVLADDSNLTDGGIDSAKDKGRLHVLGRSFAASDLAKAFSGDDPMAAIASMLGEYWATVEQDLLIASLIGVFTDNSDNDSGDLIHTAAAEATGDVNDWNDSSPTVMNPIAIVNGLKLLGDAHDKFTAIMMHSKCYFDLVKQEVIDYIQPSGVNIQIPTYLGKEIIVNDNCPTRDGSSSGTVYKSFLFGRGAIGRGEGEAPVPVETGRDELKGIDRIVTRRHLLLHPRGIAWQESSIAGASPTYSDGSGDLTAGEVAEAAQWDRVYQKKNIRIAMVETN